MKSLEPLEDRQPCGSGGVKHRLVVIGFTGVKRAYMDVSREEALRRYRESYGCVAGEEWSIKEIEFDDEFGVYDAWEV